MGNPSGYRVSVQHWGRITSDESEVRKLIEQGMNEVWDAPKGTDCPTQIETHLASIIKKGRDAEGGGHFVADSFLQFMQNKAGEAREQGKSWEWASVAAPLVKYIERYFPEYLKSVKF